MVVALEDHPVPVPEPVELAGAGQAARTRADDHDLLPLHAAANGSLRPVPDAPPVRVMLPCSGLEHAHRGFESFAREAFDELRDEPRLDLRLVKATGASGDGELAVRAITRDGRLARRFSRRQNGPIKAEQLAFAFSLQREIVRWRPQVIYFSEWYTGVGLNKLRAVNRQQYALVLSNGSMAAEGFEPFDRVHQHTAPAFEYVLRAGRRSGQAHPATGRVQVRAGARAAVGGRAARLARAARAATRADDRDQRRGA